MTAKKNVVVDIDDLTEQDLDDRLARTQALIAQILALWPGLVRLAEDERRTSAGQSLTTLASPLGALFAVLAPPNQPVPAIAKAFDVLGAQDQGKDPESFEAALLARRLYRAEAEQKIVAALDALSRHFADDVINTGEMVVGPGLLALDLARSLAKAKPEFGSLLAPVLDGFRNMTKQARKRLEQKRAGDPPPAPTTGGATGPAAPPVPAG